MSDTSLFTPTTLSPLALRNRIVMAPMTRSRAVEASTPNALMAERDYGRTAIAAHRRAGPPRPLPRTGVERAPGGSRERPG